MFVILWILSPIFFIPATFILYSKNSDLKKTNELLQKELSKTYREGLISKEGPLDLLTQVNQQDDLQIQDPVHSQVNHSLYQVSHKTDQQIDTQTGQQVDINTNKDSSISRPYTPRNGHPKKPVNPINIILSIGVCFIILSALIFATTTWFLLPNTIKVFCIILITISCFAVSSYLEKEAKLRKTNISFYILGSVLIPINILAIGFFSLFGSWFSIYGDGKYILGLVAFLLLSVSTILGALKYRLRLFSLVSLGAIATSFRFTILSFYVSINTYYFLLALFASIVLLLSNKLTSIGKQEDNPYDVLLLEVRGFAIIHFALVTFIMALISFISIPWSYTFFMAFVVLLTSTMYGGSKIKHRLIYHLQPIIVFETVLGMLNLFKPEAIPDGCFVSILAFIWFLSFYISNKKKSHVIFRTTTSDIIFSLMCFISGIVDYSTNVYSSIGCFLLFCIILFILSLGSSTNIITTISRYILPHGLLLLLIPFNENLLTSYKFLAYYIFICMAAIINIILKDKFEEQKRFNFPLYIAINLYGVICLLAGLIYFVLGIQFNTHYIYIWLFSIYYLVITFSQTTNFKKTACFYISGISFLAATLGTTLRIFPDINFAYVICVPAACSGLLFGIYLKLVKRDDEKFFIKQLYLLSRGAIAFFSVITSIYYVYQEKGSLLYLMICSGLIILSYIVFYINHQTCYTIISLIFVYPIIFKILESVMIYPGDILYISLMIITFGIFAVLGRIFNEQVVMRKDNTRNINIDWLTVINVIPVYAIRDYYDEYWQFVSWVLLAVYFMLYFNRMKGKYINNIILTLTSASAGYALWKQPFIEIPSIISTELFLFLLILFCFSLQYIWIDYKDCVEKILFGVAIFCSIILGLDAIRTELLTDVLILSIIALALLVFSFELKKKKWFLLSASTLVALVLYITDGFWSIFTWWSYLLFAGILLIFIAAKSEKSNKQLKDEIKEKIDSIFSDWD